MQSMSDKIEQMQQARGEPVAFGHLEDRIVTLVQRLDASDARLGHLEAVERGLTDLLVHIEDLRANRQSSALRAEDTSGIDTLKQDVARTQSTVEAMHGTLGQVVERLTVIEKDIHSDRRPPAAPVDDILELTQPAGNLGVGIVTDAPEIVPEPAPEVPGAALRRLSRLCRHLLPPRRSPHRPPHRRPSSFARSRRTLRLASRICHPTSRSNRARGPPRATMNPGARIVASEAALGSVRPAAATGSKSSFIAAARRAAQAAGQDPKARSPRADAAKGNGKSLRSKMMTRVKSLFLAASIVAIVIGSIQFAGNIFDFGFFDTNNAKLTQDFDADTPTGDEPNATADADTATSPDLADNQPALAPAATADITASLLAPPTMPAPVPAKPAANPGMPAIQPPLNINQATQNSLPVTAIPPLGPLLPEPKIDVTGSVTRAPAANKSAAARDTAGRRSAAGRDWRTTLAHRGAGRRCRCRLRSRHALFRRPRRARQSRGSGPLV